MKKKIEEIIASWKSSKNDKDKEQEMLSLFHQPEKEFELKNVLMDELDSVQDIHDSAPNFKVLFSKLWNKIGEDDSNKFKINRAVVKVMRVAAVVVIGLCIGILLDKEIRNITPEYHTANSPSGSVVDFVLPDSSIIYLNSGSTIKYTMNGRKGIREVFLDGEAWFNVKNVNDKKFIVHTGLYDVKVTGTSFNIRAYKEDNYIQTTLEEGEVKITSTDEFRLAEEIILKPGEQVSFSKRTKELVVKEVDTDRYTSWKNNKLIFVNMKLKDLALTLERRYGVDIEIKDESILDLHFDGIIKNESIIEILDILERVLKIEYEIVDQKIEITKSKFNK
jgi:ferric-dicitrate binding protein FerR (iron transport regulator)